MTYRFLAEARADFDIAIDWYEARQAGLGDDFIAEVYATVQRVVANPQAFPSAARAPGGREVRVTKIHRFEYLIYYEVTSNEIAILSVPHGKQR